MKQKAIIVRVDITAGGLDASELNDVLADGWKVAQTAESTPGSILE